MANATLTDMIVNPDGSIPADTDVTVSLRLVASTTLSENAAGYVTASGQTVQGRISCSSVSGALKASGGAALTVFPTTGTVGTDHTNSANIVKPTGTVYEYIVKVAGQKQITPRYLNIPDGAGPYRVQDCLTLAPASVIPAGASAYTDAAVATALGTAFLDALIYGG